MSRILICWELGGNLGHVMRLMPVARLLRERGHDVRWAYAGVRKQVSRLVENEGFASFHVPAWPPPDPAAPLSQTYGQNLLKNGYATGNLLLSHLDAWRSVIESYRPDLIVAEHAPTALLMAKAMDIPRAAIGTGYSIPPLTRIMPCLHPWVTIPEERLAEKEALFLKEVNPVLATAGCQPLDSVADIFSGAVLFLCVWPEFDHYDRYVKTYYLGPIISNSQDRPASWPVQGKENVYVYMRFRHRVFEPLLASLRKLSLPVLAFVPDITPSDAARITSGRNICITTTPVTLADVKERCLFAVTEGGVNTAALMLLSGVPLLLCPSQLEQTVLAYRLSAHGLCSMVSYFDKNPDMERKVRDMITNKPLQEKTRALSCKYGGENNDLRVERIVRDCSLMAEASAARKTPPSPAADLSKKKNPPHVTKSIRTR